MAVIEILLGERTQQGLVGGITYDPNDRLLHGVINGASDREPITELHDRFAKLKARDNLLGAVLARLGADPGARETEVYSEAGRLLDERAALVKIARGLGLDGLNVHDLPVQVLAMNTELTAALSSSQAEVKALAEENARIRAEVEQERTEKLHAMTAADIAISRSTEMEAEVRILKAKIAEADLERMLAEARLWGLASELQHLEVAMRKKLRA